MTREREILQMRKIRDSKVVLDIWKHIVGGRRSITIDGLGDVHLSGPRWRVVVLVVDDDSIGLFHHVSVVSLDVVLGCCLFSTSLHLVC